MIGAGGSGNRNGLTVAARNSNQSGIMRIGYQTQWLESVAEGTARDSTVTTVEHQPKWSHASGLCIVFVCRVCTSGLCVRFGGRQIRRSTHWFAVLRFLLFLFDVDFGGRERNSNRDDGGNGNSNRVDGGSSARTAIEAKSCIFGNQTQWLEPMAAGTETATKAESCV